MAAPVLFIKKFKEEFYFYVNYKDLNVITVKNCYFLLLISEIFNYLSCVKIFIKLNIISAFNKLQIKKKIKLSLLSAPTLVSLNI